MLLIADSGSTKTDWALAASPTSVKRLRTQGLNPILESERQIVDSLEKELRPQVDVPVDAIFFYGAGCTAEKSPTMQRALAKVFPSATTIEAQSDLMGAARALCQHEEGIACILGTGENSCLFDGEKIKKQIPPLGYILGDECSGAMLGRTLINGLYKGWLPRDLRESFEEEYRLTQALVIERVYRQPLVNRFLASLVSFIAKHIDRPELQEMLAQCFRLFLSRNIDPYNRKDLPLNFVGGVAWQFQAQLSEMAQKGGYRLGRILKAPIDSLIEYHI